MESAQLKTALREEGSPRQPMSMLGREEGGGGHTRAEAPRPLPRMEDLTESPPPLPPRDGRAAQPPPLPPYDTEALAAASAAAKQFSNEAGEAAASASNQKARLARMSSREV